MSLKNSILIMQEVALHECLEILLAPLSSLAEDRTWDRLVFGKEVHSIIRILEKIMLVAK